MKHSLFLIVIFCSVTVLYIGCDDAGISPDAEKTEVSGTVNNWTRGVKILKAVVLDSLGVNRLFLADSTTIGSNGSFTLKLKSPPDNVPYLYDLNDTSCTQHTIITPSSLKYCKIVFRVFDTTGALLGSITRRNYDIAITAGSYFAQYLYFNTDCTIKGKDTCNSFGGQIITDANLTGSKAWTKSVVLFNTYNPPFLVKASLTNTEPNGGWWSFGP